MMKTGTALSAFAASLLLSTAASADLSLLTWEGYADDSFVGPFTEATGCEVSATYVGSGDEFVAKMASAHTTYDLVSPASDIALRLADLGVVEPVDMSRVPHAADFAPAFRNPAWLTRDGEVYGVPYTFGIIRVIATPDAAVSADASLEVFWDPAHKGQVALWDDIESLYMAARYLGYDDVYNLNEMQLAATQEALSKVMPSVRKLWFSAGELDNLIQSGEVKLTNAWETNLINAWNAGTEVVEVIPPQGRGAWSDAWMISDGAGDNDCVYQWLDYVSSPKAQALGNAVTGFGYSNPKMVAELDEQSRTYMQRLGMDNPDILMAVDWWQPVPKRPAYLQAWNQVKAAN